VGPIEQLAQAEIRHAPVQTLKWKYCEKFPIKMSWLVWSVENRGWRKAGSWGYTTAAHKAAYYSEDEARKIVDRANVGGRLEGIMVPAPNPMLVEIDFRKENTIFSECSRERFAIAVIRQRTWSSK
jgi:hypothetical protein